MINPEMPQFNLAKAQKEALDMQKKVNGGAKDYNDAEKFTEEDEREKKFKNAIPVENIIPGIKNQAISSEQQTKEGVSRNDQPFPQDFWREYVRQLLNNVIARKYIKNRTDENNNFSFKDNTTELLDKSDIAHDYMKGATDGLKLFNNQIVVDLGAGKSSSGYYLSELLKAKAYVGIELWNSKLLKESIETIDSRAIKHDETESYYELSDFHNHKIPFSVIEGDILSFLKRLPDNSVSISMSGLSDVLGDMKYKKDVLKEILRVLDPNGGFLTQWSGINEDDFEDLKIVSQSLPDMHDHKFIFKKKDNETIEQEKIENTELKEKGKLLIEELSSLDFNKLEIVFDWMTRFVGILKEGSMAKINNKKIIFEFDKRKVASIFKKNGFRIKDVDIKVEEKEKSAKDIICLGLTGISHGIDIDTSFYVDFFRATEEWKNKFGVNYIRKEDG